MQHAKCILQLVNVGFIVTIRPTLCAIGLMTHSFNIGQRWHLFEFYVHSVDCIFVTVMFYTEHTTHFVFVITTTDAHGMKPLFACNIISCQGFYEEDISALQQFRFNKIMNVNNQKRLLYLKGAFSDVFYPPSLVLLLTWRGQQRASSAVLEKIRRSRFKCARQRPFKMNMTNHTSLFFLTPFKYTAIQSV